MRVGLATTDDQPDPPDVDTDGLIVFVPWGRIVVTPAELGASVTLIPVGGDGTRAGRPRSFEFRPLGIHLAIPQPREADRVETADDGA